MQADKKWLTINEAARYMGMSVAFLRKAVRFRTVPLRDEFLTPLRYYKLGSTPKVGVTGMEVHSERVR